ncbi:MAG: lipoyl synthase [Elusimicrobia bacterium]|jgi:lipoic acid synthetase|nr:lipoyl synthase [Elusimicrobiota bacterium]
MKKKKIDLKSLSQTSRKLKGLNTVCREARCPNISECFNSGRATFLILGKICTRNCSFCSVDGGKPEKPDSREPGKIAEAVKRLNLKHAVITSPTRDDLKDGGADHFLKTVRAIKEILGVSSGEPSGETTGISVELLIPDFQLNFKRGNGKKRGEKEIKKISLSGAGIVGHNIETVRRLYSIRPESSYKKSLEVLRLLKKFNPELKTKSSVMLGLGEREEEILNLMRDLRKINVDFFSAGQYLTPGKGYHPVSRYLEPDEFDFIKKEGLKMGFKHIESGRYVRSSYRAERYKI